MSLCKRNNIWWIRFTHHGKRIQKSTGTSNKVAAQRYHDELKAALWKESNLKEKRNRTWPEAVTRWLNEASHKRSLIDDKYHLKWLDPYLEHLTLKEITRDVIDRLATIREKERWRLDKKQGVSTATVNRMLSVIRAILRKAAREWEWLDREPAIKLRQEETGRVRWLTADEADRLIAALPEHLAILVEFSLATGMRQSNVTQLMWSEIDLVRAHAWVKPEKAKAKKAIAVPLNGAAMRILQQQKGKHPDYVFVYQNKPIVQCTTKAWYKALKKVNIENFRWHDLRHTWASWHVQNGTSLQELQQLGGWANFDMVLRYAHLSSDHLKQAAERVACMMIEREQSGILNFAVTSKPSNLKSSGTILVHQYFKAEELGAENP